MLSKNQMVKVRQAFETMYDSICTVIVREEYEQANGATSHRDVIVLNDEKCHLQYSSVISATQGDAATSVVQEIRLFISPDTEIPPGSKIIVDSVSYAHSGVSAKYDTHQEVVLKLWERWA